MAPGPLVNVGTRGPHRLSGVLDAAIQGLEKHVEVGSPPAGMRALIRVVIVGIKAVREAV